jgi:UDP-N-acetylmuramate dehydrogenase
MLFTHHAALDTSLKLPCTAHERYVVECIEDIPTLLLRLAGKPYRVLGGGSNVLCAVPSVDAVVQIAIKGIILLRTEPDAYIVQVGAGETWHTTVLHTLAQGWAGLENMALIPGWVGASPVQNIGAYGVELCERLHSVQAWDTQLGTMVGIAAADCGFAYRDSLFKQRAGRYLITSVTFKLPRPWQAMISYAELAAQFEGQGPTAQAIADAVIAIRQRKLPDPAVIPNAGSFFKNPLVPATQALALKAQHPTLPCYPQVDGSYKLAAGWLIEQAGWKGYTRTVGAGKVGVHAAQALVLVHLGGAQGADLLQLASDIQADVLNKFGVALVREVNVWAE